MDVALVLQGGGALGAYEYGAVSELVRNGIRPKVVTGVSIGAINSSAIAGAKGGDIAGSLKELWDRLALDVPKYIPKEHHKNMSLLGNPNFYKNRTDWWNHKEWTSLCDTRPIHETLSQVVDWDRLNDTNNVRIAVTAVNVATGVQTTFSNVNTHMDTRHIIASGSLPPGFPATEIDGQFYWDGGLFDNTPLPPMFELLTEDETENMPIILIDLVPTAELVPGNLDEVRNRMTELSFENRFWDQFGGHAGLLDHSRILEDLNKLVPQNHPLRQEAEFHRMMEYRACKNIKLITPIHQTMSEGHDFSRAGIHHRHQSGIAAARNFLEDFFTDSTSVKSKVKAKAKARA